MVRKYQSTKDITKDIMEVGRIVFRDKALPKALLKRKFERNIVR